MIELGAAGAPLGRATTVLLAPGHPAPCLAHVAAADREAARIAWAARIVDEYRSVAVFAELLHLLTDLEAPFAALAAVHALIADELRHTHACAEVAGWLGGHADLVIDLADVGLPDRGEQPKAARALAIIGRELVVGEEESVIVLAASRDATTEPAIRAVLGDLLRDEARHAAVGRALWAQFATGALAALVPDRDRAAVAAAMIDDRAELRAGYRAAAIGGPGRALGATLTGADLAAAHRRFA